MRRALFFLIAAGAVAADQPPSPFVDSGACPFECCTYREWRASKTLTLVDRPQGQRMVARIGPGEWVTALTGETRSIPLAANAPVDAPDVGIRKGDRLWLLHYEGEGVWKVWFRGQARDAEFGAIKNVPKTEWWARVRTSRGVIGWVRAEGNFENQDACS